MIFNFYTYLFFSLMAAGSAIAVFIGTVKDSNRKVIWSISSISFLVQMIISLLILFSGLIVVDPDLSEITEPSVFALVVLLLFILAFTFSKVLTLPIILSALLGLLLLFSNYLQDFIPFNDNSSLTITLLQEQAGMATVEVKGFDGEITFIEIDRDQRYPVFLIVDFPEYLFFLKSSSYIKFIDFISTPDELPQILDDYYLDSEVSKLPFIEMRLYDAQLLDDEIYSVLSIFPRRDGELIFMTEK